jgi:phytoene dehydrogenase-like protein
VDPTRAPRGCHTVKIEINLTYSLKQGSEQWGAIKDQVANSLLNHFREFAPNLTQFILSPLDIERMNAGM